MSRGLKTGHITVLLIDPTDSTRLYAADTAQGVFQWIAALRQWMPINNGLPLATFEGILALDPQHPSILYAGTSDQGIFRLDGL